MPPQSYNDSENARVTLILERVEDKVDRLRILMEGNGTPGNGFIVRVDRVEQFLKDELGFGCPDDQRIGSRVKRLENIIVPFLALATPMAIWAIIQILTFFFGAVFHPGAIRVP